MKKQKKFPCRECKNAVKNSQDAIACDSCHQWFHKQCLSMCDKVFNCYTQDDEIEWICVNCGLLGVSFSALKSPGPANDLQDVPPPIRQQHKPNQLKIVCCNFQSIWNKKDELADFLASDNIDIIIGSETHLSYNISNAEILPPEYSAARKDRDDGYGGVIII